MNEWGHKSSIFLQKISANSSTGEQNVSSVDLSLETHCLFNVKLIKMSEQLFFQCFDLRTAITFTQVAEDCILSLQNSGGTLVTQVSAAPGPMTSTSHSDVLYTHILSEYHSLLLKHNV